MSNRNKFVNLFLLAFLSYSCGSNNTQEQHTGNTEATIPSEENNTSNPTSDVPENDPSIPPHPLADLVTGDYAFRIIITTEQELPIVGKSKSTMTAYALASIYQSGDSFEIIERSCRWVMSGNELMQVTIPDTIPTSLEPVTAKIHFEGDENNLTFSREEAIQLIGTRLEDPQNDELPTTTEDERVFDQEGDGLPGATAYVAGLVEGEVYFVQRQRFSYSGSQSRDGILHGPLLDDSNQNVIDATNELLSQNLNTALIDEETTATLQPITNGYDCAQLIQEIPTLFPEG